MISIVLRKWAQYVIRIGFWGFLMIIIVYSTPKPYPNYVLRALFFSRVAAQPHRPEPRPRVRKIYCKGLGLRVWGLGFRVQGLGFRGLRFRVVLQGLLSSNTVQVWDLGFGIWGGRV